MRAGCEFDRFRLAFDRKDINQCGMFGTVRSVGILSQFTVVYLLNYSFIKNLPVIFAYK